MHFRHKIIAFVYLQIVCFFVLYIIIVPIPSYASVVDDSESILLSTPIKDKQARKIINIDNGNLFLSKNTNFNISVYIDPVRAKKKSIFKQKELIIQKKSLKCNESPCIETIEYEFSDNPISINNYPLLQIAWTQFPLIPTPEIHVNAQISYGDIGKEIFKEVEGVISNSAESKLDIKKTYRMKGMSYKKTNYTYLLKRELGIECDDSWYYRQEDERIILQARVDLPIKYSQVIQTVTDYEYPIERIQFSVDINGDGKRDHYILSEDTKFSQEIRNGLLFHTVDLTDAFNGIDVDFNKVVLLEPILFMVVNPTDFLEHKPIHKIEFSSTLNGFERKGPNSSIIQKGRMFSSELNLLKMLNKEAQSNGKLIKLKISFLYDDIPDLSLEKIKLFGSYMEDAPLLTLQPGKALATWNNDDLPIVPYDKIISFKPLIWTFDHNNIIPSLSSYEKYPFDDDDIKIFGEAFYYRIDKNKDRIILQGKFINEDSFAFLQIKPMDRPVWLNLHENNVRSIKVSNEYHKYSPNKDLNKNRIFLPEKTGLTIKLLPNNISDINNKNERLFSDWIYQININAESAFSKTEYPTAYNSTLLAKDTKIQGRLISYFNGVHPLGERFISENDNKRITTFLFINDIFDNFFLNTEDFRTHDDLSNNNLSFLHLIPKKYKYGIFDVQFANEDKYSNLKNAEWWVKEKDIPLHLKFETEKNEVDNLSALKLWHTQFPKRIVYSLPKDEFLFLHSLILPERLNSQCKVILKINQQEYIIPKEQKDIPIYGLQGVLSNFELTLKYKGEKPFPEDQTPIIKVIGLKESLSSESVLPSITIDDKIFYYDYEKYQFLKGGWHDLGDIILQKGAHHLNTENSEYFKLKTILLKTDSSIKYVPTKPHELDKNTFHSNFLFSIFKYILLAATIYFLYAYWSNVKSIFLKLSLNINIYYNQIFQRFYSPIWVIIWFLVVVILFTLGILYDVKSDNYYFIIAGLSTLILFWHISKVSKNTIFNFLPHLGNYIYHKISTIYFTWAFAMLIVACLLVGFNLEYFAEQIIIIFYYCIAAGVTFEVILTSKRMNNKIES